MFDKVMLETKRVQVFWTYCVERCSTIERAVVVYEVLCFYLMILMQCHSQLYPGGCLA